MPTPEELVAQAQLEAQVEWGTYVATGPIDINGVRAFNTGNAVPVSHVTRGVVDSSLVTKVPDPPKVTKAAVAAATESAGI
jgi:hypothetical protein